MKRLLSLCFLLPLLVGCNSGPKVTLLPDSQFDTIIDGKKVALYTLKNAKGMAMQVTNYGARVVSLWAPDRAGKMSDVVLGYKDIRIFIVMSIIRANVFSVRLSAGTGIALQTVNLL